MTDKLIILLTDIFFKLEKEGKDAYLIIGLTVPCKILYELYERLSLVDVPVIESLGVNEKQRYWEISKKYFNTEPECIIGSKAAYILSLIVNN